jgi:hypothetical protein
MAPFRYVATQLVVTWLAIVVMTADAEEGLSCETLSPRAMRASGACPPIRVRVPFPGFGGDHGVDAMYTYHGSAQGYTHAVPKSLKHSGMKISLLKSKGKGKLFRGLDNKHVWQVVRSAQHGGKTKRKVLSVCKKVSAKFPWQCTGFWSPGHIHVTEMSWTASQKYARDEVKADLSYANSIKALGTHTTSTRKIKQASRVLKEAVKTVKELSGKARYAAGTKGAFRSSVRPKKKQQKSTASNNKQHMWTSTKPRKHSHHHASYSSSSPVDTAKIVGRLARQAAGQAKVAEKLANDEDKKRTAAAKAKAHKRHTGKKSCSQSEARKKEDAESKSQDAASVGEAPTSQTQSEKGPVFNAQSHRTAQESGEGQSSGHREAWSGTESAGNCGESENRVGESSAQSGEE